MAAPDTEFTTRPTLRGTFGMVSSTHWLASSTAMSVLERGGNAFDAATSAAFVLHVVEPHLNGPGGEVPALVAPAAEDGRVRVLCGQGVAPRRATIEHYRDQGLDRVPGAGPLAATVPGAVDAWMLLLRDYGTWSVRDVLEPAIGYARNGHPLVPRIADTIAGVADLFREHWPTSAAVWLPSGEVPKPHQLFRMPGYADTLELLVLRAEREAGREDARESQIDHVRKLWREDFVAEAVDAFAAKSLWDSSGQAHPGCLTGDDLASWSATWEEPLRLDWHGTSIAKTGAWGSGPVLLQILGILQALGDPAALDLNSERDVHFVVEAVKLAMADREAWYGDVVDPPMRALLSSTYAEERARLLGALAAEELRPGSPDGRAPVLPSSAVGANPASGGGPSGAGRSSDRAPGGWAGEPTVRGRTAHAAERRGDTCHVDVVDRWGNMISATPSGGWLQSSPVIPELGFCLGTRAQMFWLEEGLPSSLEPGKRPRTTLSPTLVSRDGAPVLACGSPGGDQQDQWQLLFLLRHLAGGQSLQEAIDAPAWHTSAFPSSFWPRDSDPRSLVIEDRVSAELLAGLERRRHRITLAGPWAEGRLCAVGRDPESGVLSAGANPRGMQGYAVGR